MSRLAALGLLVALPAAGGGVAPSAGEVDAGPLAGGLSPRDPGEAVDCVPCHAEHAESWAASRHASAFVNPVFQAAWRAFPQVWCVNCHAPLVGEQARLFEAPLPPERFVAPRRVALEGVTCAVCHVRDGVVLSATPPSEEAEWAHPVAQEPALASEALCAGCHQFDFPASMPHAPLVLGGAAAQDTVAEWRAWAGGEACRDCHDHAARGGHDPAFVRGAVRVEVERVGDRVTISLATDAGHAVPTGDPFRRLVVEVCGLGCKERVLGRRFSVDGAVLSEVADTRIPAGGARAVTITVPDPDRWRVTWRYGDPRHEALLPPEEVAFVLAEGRL